MMIFGVKICYLLIEVKKMSKILLVDDEIEILENMKLLLKNYTLLYASNGKEALAILENERIDLIILDIMLPFMDGIEFLEKTIFVNIPTIALSGMDDLNTREKCYQLGIINFVKKPFQNTELLAIINGILNPIKKTPILKYKNIEINIPKNEVKLNTKIIDLTPKEYHVLIYLVENVDIALKREDILNHVWNEDSEIETRTVDVTIGNIRKKLHLKKEIKTISKVGYRLEKLN